MLHQQQLYKGQEYGKIRPSVSISFLNFTLFPELPQDYCLKFELWNREYNIQFSSDIKVITIELPKFLAAKKDKIESSLEGWLYFLCRGGELDIEHLPDTPNSQTIAKAIEELTMLSNDDLEKERYLARERVLRDEKSRLLYAHEDGLEEGLEKGIEEGKARTLRAILKRRFPNMNASIENKIMAVDPELLDDLINLILEFSDAGELELWLDKKQEMHDAHRSKSDRS